MSDPTRKLVPGQRVVSDSEPELGIGTLVAAGNRAVVVRFDAADQERRYATGSAPLRHVVFSPGDQIADQHGATHTVESVRSVDGLLHYHCDGTVVAESELAATLAVGGPRERLLLGSVDSPGDYALRRDARAALASARSSPARGLVGARVELLPHQFYIAQEVANRLSPRVLLADQTGLGKTIEACLILHRLLLSGRARRALLVVPDPLVHQWLVELSRRFNLRVALYDEERCAAIEESDPGVNPFEDEQVVLAGLSLLVDNADRAQQAAEAGWDLVVVDEAHHLEWSAGGASDAYRAVEMVAASSAGLLLLTATPTLLGEEGHFARLRLLDPARHTDFDSWRQEQTRHQQTAELGEVLASGAALTQETLEKLAATLATPQEDVQAVAATETGRSQLLATLTDRHGPGRVIFSNTRRVLPRLPRRQVELVPLSATRDTADARIDFLESQLRERDDKLLVICRTAATARRIKDQLEKRTRIPIAQFHENIELVQRDRNAAWFVEPDGARMLICSEIGSEGRNFQQARRLIMFDLPLDPDLIEQRIGRIDRIGQNHDVTIVVPYLEGTAEEVVARWHNEGVGTFEHPVAIAQPLLERFEDTTRELAARWDQDESAEDREKALAALIDETNQAAEALTLEVERGRDRLIEMSSLRHEEAEAILAVIRQHDADEDQEAFILRLLEHSQVIAESVGARSYRFDADGLARVNFAALTQGDVTFTFDREESLLREDYEFASIDHPLVLDALELLLDSEVGSSTFAKLPSNGAQALLCEAEYVLEVVAPPELALDRFLPPRPVRVLVDHRGQDRGEIALDNLTAGDVAWLNEHLPLLRPRLRDALAGADALAEEAASSIRAGAVEAAHTLLGSEADRLRDLAQVNPAIRPEEPELLETQLEAATEYLHNARLRLDAVRLIWCGD